MQIKCCNCAVIFDVKTESEDHYIDLYTDRHHILCDDCVRGDMYECASCGAKVHTVDVALIIEYGTMGDREEAFCRGCRIPTVSPTAISYN